MLLWCILRGLLPSVSVSGEEVSTNHVSSPVLLQTNHLHLTPLTNENYCHLFSHVHFSFVSSEPIIMCPGLATSHITMFNKGTKGPANKYFLMFPGNRTREKPHLLALSKLFQSQVIFGNLLAAMASRWRLTTNSCMGCLLYPPLLGGNQRVAMDVQVGLKLRPFPFVVPLPPICSCST